MNPTPLFPALFAPLNATPPDFVSLVPPDSRLETCVVIPARDESRRVAATLDAFLEQRDVQGRPLDPARFEILLLANNCRDRTAPIAREWGRNHPQIRLHVVEAHFGAADAGVGTARRSLMDAAGARLLGLPAAPVRQPSRQPRAICSTDADTLVSPFWISHTLEEMSAGAVAVGGRIFLRRDGESAAPTDAAPTDAAPTDAAPTDAAPTDAARRTYLLDTAYHLMRARLEAMLDPRCGDPSPCHFQFFGASLAIRPEIYSQIGGLPAVRCLEDVALARRLESLDIAVRHSPHVTVSTSARRCGRVETGLSTQLEEWSALRDGAPWLVPSGEEIVFKTGLQRRLRAHWLSSSHADSHNAQEIAEAAAMARRSPLELCQQLEAATYFGAWWQWFWGDVERNPAFRARFAPVPVELALRQMRRQLEGVREKR